MVLGMWKKLKAAQMREWGTDPKALATGQEISRAD